jgi:alpha-glucosidase (family GH31 glycosyl hydrolase)
MEFAEIQDVLAGQDKLTFFLFTFPKNALITLEITSPRANLLEVKLYPHKNSGPQPEAFELYAEPQALEFEETSSAYIARAGKMAAILRKGKFELSFIYDGRTLTRSGFPGLLDIEADEYIYGLGEHFTPFVRNGQSLEGHGFYVSNKGYGVLAGHHGRTGIGSEVPSKIQFTAAGETLNYFVIGGGSVKAAIANYSALTGKASLPPAWSFGLWLSVSLCAEFDEGAANRLAGGLEGISLSAVHYNRIWSDQQPPVHWLTRREDTFSGMAETLRGGLSLSMSGTAFWGHDIGGTGSSAGVFKRWAAFGLFSTHSRLHVSRSSQAPWAQDEESGEVLRHFAEIKGTLMPYHFAEAAKAAQTGVPVCRPMVMDYPHDPLCYTLYMQYMLGSSLLVAPVLSEDGHCDVYLPDGMFTNFFTGEVVQGGRIIRGKYNYMTLPVFIPENTLLPMARDPERDYHEDITVHAYHLTEQTIELYDKTGALRATITGRAHGEDVTFQVDGDAPGLRFEVH